MNNRAKGYGFVMFVVLLFMLTACSQTVSKDVAEKNAVDFVKSRVKFYSRDEQTTIASTVQEAKVSSLSSYLENSEWVVAVHVESEVNGTVKQNDIVIKVDAKTGKVSEFNGVKVTPE